MPRTVNIVGTRCTDGDHGALQRWYLDHVHQLFAFEGLLAARWVQRVDLTAHAGKSVLASSARAAANAAAPEYLCSYDFADAASFQAFESSPARAAAAADRELGWGRTGITITHRRAWERRYRREGPTPAPLWWVQCGHLAATHDNATAADPLRAVIAAHSDALDIYEIGSASAAAAVPGQLLMLWSAATARADAPIPAGMRCDWQAGYRVLGTWQR
jgi:hypothetical protein